MSLKIKMKRPFVTLKLAQSLDGKIATQSGESRGLSSSQSRKFVHRLRSQHDAILVGSKTVLKDNPLLTVRLARGKSPLRVILDSRLGISLNSRVISQIPKAKTLIATTHRAPRSKIKAFQSKGVAVWRLAQDKGGKVKLPALLKRLAKSGVKKLLVEGGGEVATAFLKERLVDRITVILTPRLIGNGIAAVGDLNIVKLGKAIRLRRENLKKLGSDIIYTATLTG